MKSNAIQSRRVYRLTESAVLVALASVLSLLKLAELPYGGAITCASMLPIVILSYRNGWGWGLGGGFVFSIIQLVTGLSSLSWFTTWQSVVAVILLDFTVAFTVSGLGGIFRSEKRSQSASFLLGSLLVSLLRYACHVISGATVWAGLSIPSSAALLYSLAYNATYMIPETAVLLVAAWYLGTALDFSPAVPRRALKNDTKGSKIYPYLLLGKLIAVGALIFDIVKIAPLLQDTETGTFTFSRLNEAPVGLLATVTGIALCILIFTLFLKLLSKKGTADGNPIER